MATIASQTFCYRGKYQVELKPKEIISLRRTFTTNQVLINFLVTFLPRIVIQRRIPFIFHINRILNFYVNFWEFFKRQILSNAVYSVGGEHSLYRYKKNNKSIKLKYQVKIFIWLEYLLIIDHYQCCF